MAKRRIQSYAVGNPLEGVFPAPVVSVRAPTTNDTNYEIGQVWINKNTNTAYILTSSASGSATWAVASPGASDVDTLTGDSGGAIAPAAGNITIAGGTGVTTVGSGSTITINAATGQAPVSVYVVDAAGGADYTTVQAALNAANGAGGGIIVLRPGTYTEDLTLYDNTQVVGLGLGDTGDYVIAGTHTPPTTGGFVFRSVKLTDATAIFSSAAAGTAHLIIIDAAIDVTNGHTFSLPNWAGILEAFDINDAGSANDGWVNNTGGATVAIYDAGAGSGTGQTMTISGTFAFSGAAIGCPVSFVTGATGTVDLSTVVGAVTFSNNSTGAISNSRISSGAAAAITMSSSAAWTLSNCVINSSNNPAIDGAGAGTLSFGALNFLDNSAFAATLTLSRDTSVDGTVRALTFDTDVAAAGLTISATDIDADGTDANISITATPKGTGTFTVDSGGILNSAGDIINAHSSAGADVTVEATNSDNTNNASRAGFEAAVGGTSGGDPYVNFLISGGQAFTIGIDNSAANDDFVISDAAALGTNNRISIDGTSGNVSIPTSDLDVTRAGGAGTAVQASVVNSDNANLDSPAVVQITSGGTSGGDAYASMLISGGQQFCVGIDNSTTNDDFVISDGAAPGTGNRISIDGSTGDTSILNNLALPTAATQLQVEGGAVTDFIGQATLAMGTVTVANTNIAAGDRIICTRSSINGSTALGILITAINAGSDFTLTAVQPGTPGSTETNDVSIVDYFIVRQL